MVELKMSLRELKLLVYLLPWRNQFLSIEEKENCLKAIDELLSNKNFVESDVSNFFAKNSFIETLVKLKIEQLEIEKRVLEQKLAHYTHLISLITK